MALFLVFLLTVIVLGLAVAVIDMVFKHQREMAGIGHQAADARVEALERRVDELSQLVCQQTIALDGVGRPMPFQDRVGAKVEA